jgi:hypothetical protein
MQYSMWLRLFNLGAYVLAIGEIIWRLHELGRERGSKLLTLSNRPFEDGPDLDRRTKMSAIRTLEGHGLIRVLPVRAKKAPVVSIVNVKDWEVTFEPTGSAGVQ